MITVGQSWVSASGVTYTIEAEIRGGYSVSVQDEKGPITASDGRWQFTPAKLRNLIKSQGLKLYDASAALDHIAERLERKKLTVLAAEIDAIANEYVEARQPMKLKNDRKRFLEESKDALKDQWKEADDPENEDRILDNANEVSDEYEYLEDYVSDTTRVSPPTPIALDVNPINRVNVVSK